MYFILTNVSTCDKLRWFRSTSALFLTGGLISYFRWIAPYVDANTTESDKFYVPRLFFIHILQDLIWFKSGSERRKTCRRIETEGRNKSATQELESIDVPEDRMRAKPNGKHKNRDVELGMEWKEQPGNWRENKTVCYMKVRMGDYTWGKSNRPAGLASVGAG